MSEQNQVIGVISYVSFVPKYLEKFWAVLFHPRYFFRQINYDDRNRDEAVLFWLTSILISVCTLSFNQLDPAESNIWSQIFVKFFQELGNVLVTTLFALFFLKLTWGLMGGKADFRKWLVVTSYISGVTTVLFALVVSMALLSCGFASFNGQCSVDEIAGVVGVAPVAIWMKSGYLHYHIVLIVGGLAIFIWLLNSWSVYRIINEVSRFRSFVAIFLYNLLWMLISGLLVGLGLFVNFISDQMNQEYAKFIDMQTTNMTALVSDELYNQAAKIGIAFLKTGVVFENLDRLPETSREKILGV